MTTSASTSPPTAARTPSSADRAAEAAVPAASAALAGAAAAALALGVSELVAGLLPGATSLVAAVGQAVIDLQPPGAKDLVVALFGTNDKLALEIVVTAVALAAGAVLGIVARRSPGLAMAGFAAFGVLAFAAALTDPLATPAIVALQVAVAVIVAVQTLMWLLSLAARRVTAPAPEIGATAVPAPAVTAPAAPAPTDPARRSFLLRTAAVGIAAVATGVAGRRLLDGSRNPPAGAAARIPPATDVVAPLAPGEDLSSQVPGLTPIVIPNDRFYQIDTALLIPSVDLASWTLRIHGLVDRETTLTWSELVALPMFEQYVTISCVSNEVGGHLVGNAKWTGVRLRDVLDMAGVQPAATQLVGRSVDGWTAGMPTAWVMDQEREPMIAVRMNDEPLPPRHGFPARLIVPGLYGYVSATKWLAELELTTLESFDGYWITKGWAKEGPILTQSRIDTPRGGVAAGRVPIAGIAWAPDRGIAKVEVEIDGTWFPATLSQPISDATWVQWMLPWDATPGAHVLRVRATDGTGALQDPGPTPPAPDGARGYHEVDVQVG